MIRQGRIDEYLILPWLIVGRSNFDKVFCIIMMIQKTYINNKQINRYIYIYIYISTDIKHVYIYIYRYQLGYRNYVKKSNREKGSLDLLSFIKKIYQTKMEGEVLMCKANRTSTNFVLGSGVAHKS